MGGPKGLFYAVAVVDIDVDVEDSGMIEEELQNGKDDIVNVAESAGFSLFGMVQTAGPINGDVRLIVSEFARSVERGTGI